MTLDDFYSDLARIAPEYTWSVDAEGKIRGRKYVGQSWAAKEIVVTPTTAHYEKCKDFGIMDIQQTLIMAEDDRRGCDPMVRAKLLEVVGLR